MLRLPTIQGLIRRRLLVNFRVEPDVMQAQLPARFRPKLHGGHAIAGICLIRLEEVRPKHAPKLLGMTSENGAHRIAVRWVEDGQEREGVYIPRRDTSSLGNHLAGGRVFPGEHHLADFAIEDDGDRVEIRMRARDDGVSLHVKGRAADTLPAGSVFGSLAEASAFFEAGSVGYSETRDAGRLDGISLVTTDWRVGALAVDEVSSSYFEDASRFPAGSVAFDCALVMRDLEHEWRSESDLTA
ncbi:MAG: DUF2071 domain-containing protein [Sandaracinaceae bacterium]|nr:DUF2071 domain-containing protein [Sandaracinaceae bacterium]